MTLLPAIYFCGDGYVKNPKIDAYIFAIFEPDVVI